MCARSYLGTANLNVKVAPARSGCHHTGIHKQHPYNPNATSIDTHGGGMTTHNHAVMGKISLATGDLLLGDR